MEDANPLKCVENTLMAENRAISIPERRRGREREREGEGESEGVTRQMEPYFV